MLHSNLSSIEQIHDEIIDLAISKEMFAYEVWQPILLDLKVILQGAIRELKSYMPFTSPEYKKVKQLVLDKNGYYSKDREKNIVFDLAIEFIERVQKNLI